VSPLPAVALETDSIVTAGPSPANFTDPTLALSHVMTGAWASAGALVSAHQTLNKTLATAVHDRVPVMTALALHRALFTNSPPLRMSDVTVGTGSPSVQSRAIDIDYY